MEKCRKCGNKADVVYAHCKSCLEEDEMSGLHEVCFDDTWVYVKCGNCGKLVYKFAKVIK